MGPSGSPTPSLFFPRCVTEGNLCLTRVSEDEQPSRCAGAASSTGTRGPSRPPLPACGPPERPHLPGPTGPPRVVSGGHVTYAQRELIAVKDGGAKGSRRGGGGAVRPDELAPLLGKGRAGRHAHARTRTRTLPRVPARPKRVPSDAPSGPGLRGSSGSKPAQNPSRSEFPRRPPCVPPGVKDRGACKGHRRGCPKLRPEFRADGRPGVHVPPRGPVGVRCAGPRPTRVAYRRWSLQRAVYPRPSTDTFLTPVSAPLPSCPWGGGFKGVIAPALPTPACPLGDRGPR